VTVIDYIFQDIHPASWSYPN